MNSKRIERILASADKALIKIGRLVLVRPIQSILLLFVAIAIAIYSHEFWSGSSKHTNTSIDLPLSQTSLDEGQVTSTDPAMPLSASAIAADSADVAVAPQAVQTEVQLETASKPSKVVDHTTSSAKATDTTPALTYLSGHVTHSLSSSARKAGFSAKQTAQLVQLFNRKNLVQQMRIGDEFSALYRNEPTKKPSKLGKSQHASNMEIVAARLMTRNKIYQLIRFVDPKGHVEYYTPEGYSLHDALSRQPLRFTYISSYFASNRLDPVLHYHRPHEGVDFAAPLGTPIQAAGDGVLKEVTYRNGYGRTVVIQHDGRYTTRYAHLSKFANNIGAGQFVKKGQIIGYVGQSGFATGPHLHYEIRINDVAFNPLTVALPSASVPAPYRRQFLAQSKVLLAALNGKRQVWLAQKKSGVNVLKQSG